MGKLPVPARITLALDARGLAGPEVDQACGVQEPEVDLWELGRIVPTRAQILLLAKLTDFPPEFFYGDAPPPSVLYVCSRSRRKGERCERVTSPLPPPAADGKPYQSHLF